MGAVLAGACLSFSVHPGSLGDFMAAANSLFVLNALIGNFRWRQFGIGDLAVFAIIALVLCFSLAVSSGRFHERSLRYLILVPGLVLACHGFAQQLHDIKPKIKLLIMTALLCACITSQFLGPWLRQDKVTFGFYDNRHHLGLFASLTLPWLGWLVLQLYGWPRVVALAGALAGMALLWRSGSRISWLVFFSSAILSAFLFLTRRQLIVFLLGLFVLTGVAAWLTGFSAIGDRIEDLRATFLTEERIFLWPAAFESLQQNSWREWLFGHGIGSFRFAFNTPIPEIKEVSHFAFPHNAILQMAFENGLVGLLLIAGGFSALLRMLWRMCRRSGSSGERHLAVSLFTQLCIVAGQCLLTKSIYSRYILFSLSLITGAALALPVKNRESL
jgi:O-antigen ligase